MKATQTLQQVIKQFDREDQADFNDNITIYRTEEGYTIPFSDQFHAHDNGTSSRNYGSVAEVYSALLHNRIKWDTRWQ